MLVAKDFREKARAALNGKWALAVGTGFVASLLGAGTLSASGSSGGSSSANAEDYETMFSEMPEEVLAVFIIIMLVLVGIALLWALVLFIIGGPITLGYVKFNLGLVDGAPVKFGDLFSQFHRFGAGFLVQFLRNLYVTLWMLIFVGPAYIIAIVLGVMVGFSGGGESAVVAAVAIPVVVGLIPAVILGVYKEYGYTMAAYILYENPDMSANQAIKESTKLMQGNKWRLFCLSISFLGWSCLSLLTCGIGTLWLRPYQEAAFAAFYREIKRERYGEPVITEQSYVNPYEQGSVYSDYNNVQF